MVEAGFHRLDHPYEISPHLYVVAAEFPHKWNANVYLLTGEQNSLIDCGNSEGIPNLRSNMRQLGLGFRDIHNVLVTHGHVDHIHGIHEIRDENPEVNVYVHKKDVRAIQRGDKRRTATSLYELHFDTELDFDPIHIDRKHRLHDKQVIESGEHDVYVHHTPGHTPGSVCFLTEVDNSKYLFAGDTWMGRAIEGSKVDIQKWRNSLIKLGNIDFNGILNGHNPVGDLPIPKEKLIEQIPVFGMMSDPFDRIKETLTPLLNAYKVE